MLDLISLSSIINSIKISFYYHAAMVTNLKTQLLKSHRTTSTTKTNRSPMSAHLTPTANLLQPTNTIRPRIAKNYVYVLSKYSNPTMSSQGTTGQRTIYTTTTSR